MASGGPLRVHPQTIPFSSKLIALGPCQTARILVARVPVCPVDPAKLVEPVDTWWGTRCSSFPQLLGNMGMGWETLGISFSPPHSMVAGRSRPDQSQFPEARLQATGTSFQHANSMQRKKTIDSPWQWLTADGMLDFTQ